MEAKKHEIVPPTFIIQNAAAMTVFERRSIAAWLKLQARNLTKHGAKYPWQHIATYETK